MNIEYSHTMAKKKRQSRSKSEKQKLLKAENQMKNLYASVKKYRKGKSISSNEKKKEAFPVVIGLIKGKTVRDASWLMDIPLKMALEACENLEPPIGPKTVIEGRLADQIAGRWVKFHIQRYSISSKKNPILRNKNIRNQRARIVYTPLNGQPGWKRKK